MQLEETILSCGVAEAVECGEFGGAFDGRDVVGVVSGDGDGLGFVGEMGLVRRHEFDLEEDEEEKEEEEEVF